MLQPRPQDPFQRRVDLGEQAVQPVRDAGGLAGQVVVVADDHLQLGDRLVLAVDHPQRVRIARAASAMMKASRASVFASPG